MSQHPHWQTLLTWLATAHGVDPDAIPVQASERSGAGHGLFALTALKPHSFLFSIPSSALINKLTLSSSYPVAHTFLTATQLISLHLSLNRPVNGRDSPDPVFGAYISTLPRAFDAHPLTWLVEKDQNTLSAIFLPVLPPSVMRSLLKLADRFRDDWAAVQLNIPRLSDLGPISIKKQDYLWAWLNVNTRCLYYRAELSPSDKNNITLCPILDFANHSTTLEHMSPLSPKANRVSGPSKVTGTDFTMLSPLSAINLGDELYLNYGPHSNRTLFVEYGFVNEFSKKILDSGNAHEEIDIQEELEILLAAKGELGMWMQEALKNQGYWGDWSLHLTPFPAHPSFRVIVALRLYNIFRESLTTIPSNVEILLQPWIATLLGTADKISEENENAWRGTLLYLCDRVTRNARLGLESLEKVSEVEQITWFPWMKRNVRLLWEEEIHVAGAVADSICNGEEF